MKVTRIHKVLAPLAAGALLGGALVVSQRWTVVAAPQDGQAITVAGCLERDAASRVVVYKLVAKVANGPQIYRLTAPASINLAAELGHTIEVSGTATTREATPGRNETVIAVRTVKVLADRCS